MGATTKASVEPFLPFSQPDIRQEEIDEVVDTLRSGWLTSGPKVRAFEEQFREATGAAHAVALSSCTAGLHLALLAAEIGPGDEVITTPITFAATANMILHVGGTPVLADVREDDYNIDPAAVERRITARTKAIMPVHFAGLPCRMDELLALGRAHGLRVIEDAAHALGASYHGRPIGALSDAAVFSFYPIKNITTGQGGMLTTDDDDFAEKTRLLSLHGLSKGAWDRYTDKGSWAYQVLMPGFNYVMTDIQASLGIHQLARLDEIQARRAHLAARYDELFALVPEVIRPPQLGGTVHAWHLYPMRLELERLRIDRADFVEALRERGIGTTVNFIPIHFHPYFQKTLGLHEGDYPVAERVFAGEVSLPLYPRMQDSDVERVVAAVREIIDAARR
ncbi:MAG: DegT/DnrJ/EryC1/StrS aminotransferase family protein [Dehalococcoidia bacterium]